MSRKEDERDLLIMRLFDEGASSDHVAFMVRLPVAQVKRIRKGIMRTLRMMEPAQ
jgi:hypothetical protein